jgi:hypothetical protein
MKCFHCGEQHSSTRCPDLHSPLKDGFYSGGGGHSHDEDSKNGFKKWKVINQYPKRNSKLLQQNALLRV